MPEARRPYVFPACGHVHGYHPSLEGAPCPMCRAQGPFVPVALAFDSVAISRDLPTHVFNPCGHAASKSVCEYWGALPVYDFTPSTLDTVRPQCPFCAR